MCTVMVRQGPDFARVILHNQHSPLTTYQSHLASSQHDQLPPAFDPSSCLCHRPTRTYPALLHHRPSTLSTAPAYIHLLPVDIASRHSRAFPPFTSLHAAAARAQRPLARTPTTILPAAASQEHVTMAKDELNVPSLVVVLVVSGFLIRHFFFRGSGSSSTDASSRASSTGNSREQRNAEALNRRFEDAVARIQQIFPYVDRRDVWWELRRNGLNINAATERILSGGLDNVSPCRDRERRREREES